MLHSPGVIKFGRPVLVDVEARLPRVVEALARDDRVEALWLFGSRARNEHDALSDVDLAVLARDGLGASALWDAQLAWTRLAVEAVGTDEVAVHVVNRLPAAVRHAIFKLSIRADATVRQKVLGPRLLTVTVG